MNDAATISCKEAARLMSRQQDAILSPEEQGRLKEHLFLCLSCRRFDQQLAFLRQLAHRYADGDAAESTEPV